MTKGEKAQFQLKPKVAFGKEGNKEFDIPPNATVMYTVQLKELEKVRALFVNYF